MVKAHTGPLSIDALFNAEDVAILSAVYEAGIVTHDVIALHDVMTDNVYVIHGKDILDSDQELFTSAVIACDFDSPLVTRLLQLVRGIRGKEIELI